MADYKADNYRCDRDSNMDRDPSLANSLIWNRCMEAHGWVSKPGEGEFNDFVR